MQKIRLFVSDARELETGAGCPVVRGAAAPNHLLSHGGVIGSAGSSGAFAGHDPWFEQPDEFFAAVRRFLQARVLK